MTKIKVLYTRKFDEDDEGQQDARWFDTMNEANDWIASSTEFNKKYGIELMIDSITEEEW